MDSKTISQSPCLNLFCVLPCLVVHNLILCIPAMLIVWGSRLVYLALTSALLVLQLMLTLLCRRPCLRKACSSSDAVRWWPAGLPGLSTTPPTPGLPPATPGLGPAHDPTPDPSFTTTSPKCCAAQQSHAGERVQSSCCTAPVQVTVERVDPSAKQLSVVLAVATC